MRTLFDRSFVIRTGPLLVVALSAAAPRPAAAQLGALEAFARRVTDLSFNGYLGGLSPGSDEVSSEPFGVKSFGLELLFEIASVEDTVGPAPAQPDSVALEWTEMVVVVGEDGVDTTYVYEVSRAPAPSPPTRPIWIFEMGLGYGQTFGWESAIPDLDFRGQVRDLPAVSLYASYEPIGNYLGLRSGFMRIQGLQAFEAGGGAFSGKGESFLLAGLAGYAAEVSGLTFFLEAVYSVRTFPSIEWQSASFGGSLSPSLPQELSFSGWSIGTGVQFKIGA